MPLLFDKLLFLKSKLVTMKERIIVLFSGFIFVGYFLVGVLYARGTYLELRTGELERRVDRLLYDRYAICGAGMIIFPGFVCAVLQAGVV